MCITRSGKNLLKLLDSHQSRRHVLVVFGGRARHPADDLNKLPWMVRIAGSAYPEEGLREVDYLDSGRYIRVGTEGARESGRSNSAPRNRERRSLDVRASRFLRQPVLVSPRLPPVPDFKQLQCR